MPCLTSTGVPWPCEGDSASGSAAAPWQPSAMLDRDYVRPEVAGKALTAGPHPAPSPPPPPPGALDQP